MADNVMALRGVSCLNGAFLAARPATAGSGAPSLSRPRRIYALHRKRVQAAHGRGGTKERLRPWPGSTPLRAVMRGPGMRRKQTARVGRLLIFFFFLFRFLCSLARVYWPHSARTCARGSLAYSSCSG